jgi:exopolysaccharide biosynthesis polyprenyl glycosylphosphotransferase
VLLEVAIITAVVALFLSNPAFGDGDVHYAVSAAVATGIFVLLVALLSGGATYERFSSRLSILAAAVAGSLVMALAAAFAGAYLLQIAWSAAFVLVAVPMAKVLTTAIKNLLWKRGHLTRLVAVATDDVVQLTALLRLLRRRDDIELVFAGSPTQLDKLGELTQANQLDEIVLSGHQTNEENITALMGLAVTLVRVAPHDRLDFDAFDPLWGKKRMFGAWSAPASIISLPPLHGWGGVIKRLIDITGAAIACALFSPVLIACALALKVESPGPILFIQERAGYRNKPFRMFKFRSMYADQADHTGSKLTLHNDARVTRVGAILRRTSMDELPQLLNVLKGDMSLVGPRPHPKGAKAGTVLYDDLIPHFYSRYRMKPGITGLAQVSGFRGNTETEQHLIDRFGRDLQYAAEWTPILDIAIIFRTVAHLFKGTNAY